METAPPERGGQSDGAASDGNGSVAGGAGAVEVAGPRGSAPTTTQPTIHRRMHGWIRDPMTFAMIGALAVVFPASLIARHFGVLADVPTWAFATILSVAAAYAVAMWELPPPRSELMVSLRSAGLAFTIGTASYTCGWGAAFSVGFLFAADQGLRSMGSRAGRHILVWTIAAIGVGEILVAHHVFPSVPPRNLLHGIAVFSVIAACMLIGSFTWTAREKERAEGDLRRSEERFRSLVQKAADAIMVTDAERRVLYASPTFERLVGDRSVALTRIEPEILHPDDFEKAAHAYGEVVASPGLSTSTELRMRVADGSFRWFEVEITNHRDDPSVEGIVWNLHDITDRKRFEAELRHHAYHDALTLLPNRVAFVDRLSTSLQRNRDRGGSLAVLFLDVDRFKVVNDSLGHEVGDRLLIEVAERLQRCVRPGDILARFGGDEFTILLDDVPDEHAASSVADRIAEVFREPIQLATHQLVVSTSAGIAVSVDGDASANEMLRRADLAMYVAKEKGRSRWEMFKEESAPPVVERLGLESELYRALENHELVVYFQPEMSLETGRVVAAEALVRWDHPERGFLLPNSFIPFAEESSLIVAIDRYVLHEACHWALQWGEHSSEPPIVSVNLSPRFVHQPNAVEDIVSTIRETGLAPDRVQLEITERTALAVIESTTHSLDKLREHGIRVAIDDFGTGYSSLSYLKRLPVDVVKLDKSFVDEMDGLEPDAAIVHAAITMGHALGMKVTAEGVERAEQAALLRTLGCDSATGWHWSKAVPASLLEPVLETGFPMPDPEPHVRPLRPAIGD